MTDDAGTGATRAADGETEAERTVTITWVMDVPARYVFLAHTDPEHLLRWFGPKDYPLTLCEQDFRVGGRWRFAMTGPDGVQGEPFGGTYLEIEPDRRIVYDNAFEDGRGGGMDLRHAGRMVTTVSLEEEGGRTTVTISTLFATVAMKEEYLGVGFLVGTASALDQLAAVAAGLAAAGRRAEATPA